MNSIKLKAKRAARAIIAKRKDYEEAVKPYIDRSIAYARENPSDIMLGIMTLLLMDIESEVDDLEEHTGLSAAVDYHTYTTYK